ncbi:MAG: signal recognition particle-docking protein FtsY [Oscillospiraceae bacterium]|nr:signal recognition particle-docking protein FtsY [Oscillospiraceae bacterium]
MGFFDKIKQGLGKTQKNIGGMFREFSGANDEFYDELEEKLILADVGAEFALSAVEALRTEAKANNYKTAGEIRAAMARILAELLPRGGGELRLSTVPSVILMIGVNGVGKTTTIGKLAMRLRGEGRSVILVAGDTFRAAAAEQLSVWAERGGVDIVRHGEGADPASVVFDGIAAAKARKADVIIIDTAGRLQNKSNLMHELAKISKIIDRELPGADRETLIVIDAVTGQNGLIQAREFAASAGLTGIVLTKLDGTAKGGIVIPISKTLGVPVKFIGVGEGIDDLVPFDTDDFLEAMLE